MCTLVARIADTLRASLNRSGPVITLAVLLLLGAAAPARAQLDTIRFHSSPVGVADGQYARLAAYFVESESPRPELPPGPCRVTMRLLDAAGSTVAESVISLGPGRDAVLDFRPEGLRAGDRATVRAVILAARDTNGLAPRIIPSLEVVDTATGRTTISTPGLVRGLTQQPSGSFGTFGLASMQVARVTAAYVGLPTESGLPPAPCNVTLALYSGNGAILASREVTVSPGQTASIDFPAGYMVAGVRRRMWAKTASDGRAQGFVTASVEIFDAPTGRSASIHPAAFVQSWGWE